MPQERDAVVTIGTFDGVHRGHCAVLQQLQAWASELRAPSGVITFSEHPRRVIQGQGPDLLTSLRHRLVLFERAGIGFAWVLDFNEAIRQMSAREFARRYLVEALRIRGLILGFDNRFGCDRLGGDSADAEGLAADLGFAVRCLERVKTPDGMSISSTLIRDAIWEGRLRDAEAMLGRRVSVLGTVVQGDARGRRMGYRTANLNLSREIRPPFGVYATLALFQGRSYGSITNVGYRPTVSAPLAPGVKPDLLLETHLLDFEGDLYGKELEIQFIEKIRDERRFPDVASLAAQIRKDEEKARGILEALGQAG